MTIRISQAANRIQTACSTLFLRMQRRAGSNELAAVSLSIFLSEKLVNVFSQSFLRNCSASFWARNFNPFPGNFLVFLSSGHGGFQTFASNLAVASKWSDLLGSVGFGRVFRWACADLGFPAELEELSATNKISLLKNKNRKLLRKFVGRFIRKLSWR